MATTKKLLKGKKKWFSQQTSESLIISAGILALLAAHRGAFIGK